MKMAVLAGAAVVAVAAAAMVAALLSSPDALRDVAVLEIGGGEGRVELVPVDAGAAGPESLAFDPAGGGPYAGVSDGRVLRWVPGERRWEEHSASCAPELLDSCRGSQDPGREHECGRPLGLKFNPDTGELYVADAYHGLRMVAPGPGGGKASRPVAPEWWQGARAFSFANGVEVDPGTGAVYFTETSTRFQRREFLRIVVSGDTTGRLLRYDPRGGGGVEVLADGLAFPNGLAMSSDGTHLLLAETTTGRILRYWLRPTAPKAPALLEEVARLPWFPDNIRMSPRGGFWVGLHARRGKLAQYCISYPWLRRLVLALPPRHVQRASSLLSRLGRQVIALRLSEEDGRVVEMASVHGDLRRVFRSVSEVAERNGSIWIGSVMSPFLGVYKLQ
ncbi:Strictosidine synthase 3 precursor [Zea mays]|uniref:Strictosidine synthase 3 n=1 Tax=Zea mays TaxID=4577 RepID=B4FHQ2_MAIZE|nr:Strictosidine synthase 3 precursor [Zea mays]ACF81645.1 unknown [Zea mays]ACG41619.1 strictosidine synthase 3 precursor [Zea mays]|eukprot:NP_001132695.1 Strictosidine synthase 3 precursor [Zea mays]